MSRNLWCLLILLVAGGCASRSGAVPAPFPRPNRVPGLPTEASTTRPPDPYAITSTALDLRGVPFVDGGSTPAGFDCSGFTYHVFRQHGVELPRLAAQQYRVGSAIDPNAIEPGDLLFFSTVARRMWGWRSAGMSSCMPRPNGGRCAWSDWARAIGRDGFSAPAASWTGLPDGRRSYRRQKAEET
jgi:hypothetical protein